MTARSIRADTKAFVSALDRMSRGGFKIDIVKNSTFFFSENKKSITAQEVEVNWSKNKIRYQDAPYHHVNSKGSKNLPPSNPIKALQDSVVIKDTSSRRIAVDVEKNNFIILDKTTANGDWYGHSRSWKELSQDQKNALIRNKLTNHKGKIIK